MDDADAILSKDELECIHCAIVLLEDERTRFQKERAEAYPQLVCSLELIRTTDCKFLAEEDEKGGISVIHGDDI